MLLEHEPVRQPCQGIVIGEEMQVVLCPAALQEMAHLACNRVCHGDHLRLGVAPLSRIELGDSKHFRARAQRK
jgi:hypothetical protein